MGTPTQSAAREYHANMTALRSGKIKPNEFRARVAAMREVFSPAEMESIKAHAIAASNR